MQGRSVLYIGDHIFGDILKCKKHKGWKTFLVVEELDHQLACWVKCKPLIRELERVDFIKVNNHRGHYSLTCQASEAEDGEKTMNGGEAMTNGLSEVKMGLKEKLRAVDLTYGKLGGLFQSGSRETFFASQVNCTPAFTL